MVSHSFIIINIRFNIYVNTLFNQWFIVSSFWKIHFICICFIVVAGAKWLLVIVTALFGLFVRSFVLGLVLSGYCIMCSVCVWALYVCYCWIAFNIPACCPVFLSKFSYIPIYRIITMPIMIILNKDWLENILEKLIFILQFDLIVFFFRFFFIFGRTSIFSVEIHILTGECVCVFHKRIFVIILIIKFKFLLFLFGFEMRARCTRQKYEPVSDYKQHKMTRKKITVCWIIWFFRIAINIAIIVQKFK